MEQALNPFQKIIAAYDDSEEARDALPQASSWARCLVRLYRRSPLLSQHRRIQPSLRQLVLV